MSAHVAFVEVRPGIAYTAFRSFMRVVSFALFAFILAVVAAVGIVPWFLHATAMTVLTQSMEPTIKAGDTVVVRAHEQVEIGDVITYQTKSGVAEFVTHRVVGKSFQNGKTMYVTKGDNNKDNDKPVREEQIAGKVLYSVPKTGYLTQSLRDNPLPTSLALTGVVLLAAFMVPSKRIRWERYNPTTDIRREDEDTDTRKGDETAPSVK